MIRLALPKGRNLKIALDAFKAAGLLSGLDPSSRSLRVQLPEEEVEVLWLKDWDVPVYVEHGVADCGIVGSDVLDEIGGDLLVPLRLRDGRSRLSLIGRTRDRPAAGSQIRLATKYPNTARRVLKRYPWGAEIIELSGSIELAPLLQLAEMALDIVQTGQTLKENGLFLIETVDEVAACLVVNRASYQRHRQKLGEWIGRLVEKADIEEVGRKSGSIVIRKADTPAGRESVERLIARGGEVLDAKTLSRAASIVEDVRKRGDEALCRYTRELDGIAAESITDLTLEPSRPDEELLPAGFVAAMEEAIAAVKRFHVPQVREGYVQESDGALLEERIEPLRRVGIYVPGGRAAYPSTVVMTVVPAQVAGVQEIAVATPPGFWRSNPALRWTLDRLGVREVWGIGGAHAVAAFAYGTQTIQRVDKIVGPGNAWVTAAKKLVVGDVAIDGIAGPSEVVIVADSSGTASHLAADLLAQAEHDPQAAAVLITPDPDLAVQVAAEIEQQLEALTTAGTARVALERFGAILVVDSMEEALDLVNRIAPEHLQLVGPAAEALADRVTAVGAIFLGPFTPEVFGDYIAGPSHVLPTCGSARFASSLGVEDFLRRSHRIRFTPEAAARRAAAAATLAEVEGLPGHAASARRRLQ